MNEHPPSFYEEDLERYKEKFRESIGKRLEYKKSVEKVYRSIEGGLKVQEDGDRWHKILARKST